jgi:hypothetical protein
MPYFLFGKGFHLTNKISVLQPALTNSPTIVLDLDLKGKRDVGNNNTHEQIAAPYMKPNLWYWMIDQ